MIFLWCVRDWLRQGQTALLTQILLLTITCCVIFKNPLSTSSASWLGFALPGVAESHIPQSTSCPSLWPSCTNWLNCCRRLPIYFHNANLFPLLLPLLLLLLLLLLIYTGASLIVGSVKGQYTTKLTLDISFPVYFSNNNNNNNNNSNNNITTPYICQKSNQRTIPFSCNMDGWNVSGENIIFMTCKFAFFYISLFYQV